MERLDAILRLRAINLDNSKVIDFIRRMASSMEGKTELWIEISRMAIEELWLTQREEDGEIEDSTIQSEDWLLKEDDHWITTQMGGRYAK